MYGLRYPRHETHARSRCHTQRTSHSDVQAGVQRSIVLLVQPATHRHGCIAISTPTALGTADEIKTLINENPGGLGLALGVIYAR